MRQERVDRGANTATEIQTHEKQRHWQQFLIDFINQHKTQYDIGTIMEQITSRDATEASARPARLFSPLIERGTCVAALCSDRLPETLRIVQSNLDIVAAEVESAAAQATGDGSEQRQIRTESKKLLDRTGRVRRGEQPIGSAQ